MRKQTRLALVALVALAMLLGAMPATSFAAVITFGGLSGSTGTPFLPYSEAGFLVTPLTGRWLELTTSSPDPGNTGNPGPSIWEDTFTASLEVTKTTGGPLFTFASVDVWGETADFTIVGLLGGAPVFTTSAGVPNDDWLTIGSPSSATIDALRISVVRDQAEGTFLDNIGVSEVAPVPELPAVVLWLVSAAIASLIAVVRPSRRVPGSN